jgi:hypothetical protein
MMAIGPNKYVIVIYDHACRTADVGEQGEQSVDILHAQKNGLTGKPAGRTTSSCHIDAHAPHRLDLKNVPPYEPSVGVAREVG